MIFVASDHEGLELKKKIVDHLTSKGLGVQDVGPFEFHKDDDYPNFIYPCAVKVAQDANNRGIVLGLTGNGEAMVANKVKGIRAAVYNANNLKIAELSRRHNDANMLSLGAGFLSTEEALQAIDVWLATAFEGGRHERRIEEITSLER